jgi:hypothetical protein
VSTTRKKSTTKGVSFLRETGEVVELDIHKPQKVRYAFLGHWRVYGVIEVNKVLNEMDLTRSEIRVALWLPTIAKNGNMAVVSGKMSESILRIDRHTFSRILGKLVKLDLIKRGEARGVYYINPQFAWHGPVAGHRIAKEQWYRESLTLKPQFNRTGDERMVSTG